eukprot:COSAG02_NODE_86_length_39084_cov_17.815724_25_plen_591_part_00
MRANASPRRWRVRRARRAAGESGGAVRAALQASRSAARREEHFNCYSATGTSECQHHKDKPTTSNEPSASRGAARNSSISRWIDPLVLRQVPRGGGARACKGCNTRLRVGRMARISATAATLSLVASVLAQSGYEPGPWPPLPKPHAPPLELRCTGATPRSVELSWRQQTEIDVDMFDVECGPPGRRPFVSQTVPAVTGAVVQTTKLMNLTASLELQCQVRSHLAGAPSIVGRWSTLSQPPVSCSTAGTRYAGRPLPPGSSIPEHGLEDDRRSDDVSTLGTRVVPMWRISEYAYTEHVDYLVNHNSGTFGGMVALLNNNGLTLWNFTNACINAIRHVCPHIPGNQTSGVECLDCARAHSPQLAAAGLCDANASSTLAKSQFEVDKVAACGMGNDPVPLFLPLESPMVGYCVEMLDVPFSRYQSCNGGAMRDGGTEPICECQLGGNREEAADSKASIALHCSGPSGCTCTDDGQHLSERFVGRMDYVMTTSDAGAQPFVAGYWYSTPRLGECPPNVSLGTNGCTWRRRPQAHMLWLSDMIEAGFDNTPTTLNFTHARYAHNAAILNGSMMDLWQHFSYLGGAGPCAETFPQ